MYVGLHMLARVQAEEKVKAIKDISKKSRLIRRLIREEQRKRDNGDYNVKSTQQTASSEENDDPFSYHTAFRDERVHSLFILCSDDSAQNYAVCERELVSDLAMMTEASIYSRYAQIIYSKLRIFVGEVMGQEVSQFVRGASELFTEELGIELTGIGCEHAELCYANFSVSLVQTPYAILIDKQLSKIVITVRGTMSLDDMVIDLQYNPASLETIGETCGFEGFGHFCHKGFLTRAKWLYNDITK